MAKRLVLVIASLQFIFIGAAIKAYPTGEQSRIYFDGAAARVGDENGNFFFIARDSSVEPDLSSGGSTLDEEIGEGDIEDIESESELEEGLHEQESPLGIRDNTNMFAFQEFANLEQLVQRGQAFATSNAGEEGGGGGNPTACLPDVCHRYNNEVEQGMQYLPRLNPGPTLTNLLLASCASSRSLVECVRNDDQKSSCNEASRRATWSAIDLRHGQLCNMSTLIGQCVTAIEVSPAHRYCVVTAIANTAHSKNIKNTTNSKQNDVTFDLCSAVNNFTKCTLQGASVCNWPSETPSDQMDPERQKFMSQAFFTLVHRFRQNKIYFAEFGRSLGMEANQLLVNYALLAGDEKQLTPEAMTSLCLPLTTTVATTKKQTTTENSMMTTSLLPHHQRSTSTVMTLTNGNQTASISEKLPSNSQDTEYRPILRTSKAGNTIANSSSSQHQKQPNSLLVALVFLLASSFFCFSSSPWRRPFL